MKTFVLILITVIGFASCQNAEKKVTGKELTDEDRMNALKDSSNFTTVQWLDSTYIDAGTAKEGAQVEVNFRFKNTGDNNLIISNVSAQCGCTTPDWPKYPIASGKEGVIKAVFNSSSRPGENRKEVYVQANSVPQSSITLTFRVEVTK